MKAIKLVGWLVLILTLTACGADRSQAPEAQTGEIDLSAWRFERDGPVDLIGEWEFYWQRLLTSAEIGTTSHAQIVELPGWWNGYQIAGEKLGGMGYATYHLRVKLPPTAANLALDIPEFETAYRLYIDETLIAQNGRVGATPTTTTPTWRPQIISFEPPNDGDNGEFDLILQIANFHHRRGGAGQIIQLGNDQQLHHLQTRRIALTFLLLGGLVMMGLYHAGLYLLRPKELSAIYFGLICILMAIRLLVSGDYYAAQRWPNFGWAWIVRLNYLSFDLTVPFFGYFAHRLFPEEIPRWLLSALTISAALYTALILLTPVRIFTHALPLYQVISILAAIITLIQIIQATRHRRQGAHIFLIGFLILIAAMINDILHNNQIIHTAFIGPMGAFFFIFFQAYLLAGRFVTAFVEVERLSRELEARVAQRTQELARRNENLGELNVELSQEITRRERAEAQLRSAKEAAEAANQAKSTFLANVSHELRTPMNAVLGFAKLISADANLTETQRQNLAIIQRSGDHLLSLINDILDLSKIEAGRMEIQPKIFHLPLMLQGLSEMFSLRADEKNLTLTLDLAPNIPHRIRADENKLRQVLINLLGNAVKFTASGGITMNVALHQASDDALLHFEIADTGVGIAPEELDQVFETFVQTESGRQAQTGTGLGLPISREYVRIMGGDLTVESEVGVGSKFEFDIPVEVINFEAVKRQRRQQRVVGLAEGQPAYKILIAENRIDNQKLMRSHLARAGFEVQVAAKGKEAVERWQRWRPDLIFVDVRMPRKDGLATIQQIKSLPGGDETVIVAVTASAFEEERAAILAGGCDDFLRKPYREADIFDIIAHHLDVSYIYKPLPDQRTGPAREMQASDVKAADFTLTDLPDDWRAALQQATIEGDMAWMSDLTEDIQASHPRLAQQLSQWIDNFQHDEILTLLEQINLKDEKRT